MKKLALLLGLTAVVYVSSFSNAFLNWDDPINVTQNVAIRAFSMSNARVWFTEPLIGMYSPFVYVSYATDYQIGGLNPFVYHATNLGLHLICVLLVFAIATRLTGPALAPSASAGTPVGALVAAALFAVHPANVAAVAPISVRSSLLYSVFYLAAYWAYLRYLEKPGAVRLAASFLLFVCAGLSKSAAAVFPLLLLLTDWFTGRKLTRSTVVEKIQFFVVAVAIGTMTLVLRSDVATGDPLHTSWLERAALAGYQVGHYALTAVVPLGLSPFYPYPERADGSLPAVVFIVAALVVVAALAVARWGRSQRVILFGLAFFVLHLLLVLKIVPLGEEFTADRYLYLPLVGLGVTGAGLAGQMSPRARQALFSAACLVIVFFSVASSHRQSHWRDDMTFNSRILERYPRTATAYSNRAAARLQQGDADGALRDSTDAIRIDSSNARAYFNRATAGMMLGRAGEALADATRSIELDPSLPATYELRAQARLNTNDLKGARDDADRAIAMNPDGAEVFKSYVTRGLARAMLDDGAGAIADLDRAIALNPGEPALLQNRGQIRINSGDKPGGCADLRQAVARGRTEANALVKTLCRD